MNSKPNHSASITKQLPWMTNENEFNKTKPLSQSALKNSGFNDSMKFEAAVEKLRQTKKKENHMAQSVI